MTAPFFFHRPTAADLSEVFRVHSDPRTNVHNPAGPDDEAASRTRLAEWMEHWQRHGFGYEVIGDATGAVLGCAGVRHGSWLEVPVLNLYYRLAREAWGRGIATAAGRRARDTAARVAPDVPVLARTKPENVPAQRTAVTIGLRRRPELEADDETGAVRIYTSSWPH